jgi:hypothetical protein
LTQRTEGGAQAQVRRGAGAGLEDHGLFVVAAVVEQELDLVLADLDGVVVSQQLLLDRLAVDVGAVGGIEVFDEDVGADHLQHGVFAADREIVDDDVVVGTPTQCGLVLGDLHFFDHDAVERNHQFAHL